MARYYRTVSTRCGGIAVLEVVVFYYRSLNALPDQTLGPP